MNALNVRNDSHIAVVDMVLQDFIDGGL